MHGKYCVKITGKGLITAIYFLFKKVLDVTLVCNYTLNDII